MDIAAPPCPAAATTAPPTSQTFPPLIVDTMEDWVSHFAHLSRILGHAPHSKPYKSGIKFLPESTQEYRTVQRYLHGLDVDWHSYALPEERALKVAIYGLPGSTPLKAVTQGLAALGFEAEHVSRISGRGGRPGLIFFARLRRSQDLIPAKYGVTEILNMPNVKIEAWRGNKRGPAQCYRCQQFRHSSQHCHRKLACLKCAEEHKAEDCPLDRDATPRCANCAGPHPANYRKCPVYQREARNRFAGPGALSNRGAPRRVNRSASPPAGRDPPIPEQEHPINTFFTLSIVPIQNQEVGHLAH